MRSLEEEAAIWRAAEAVCLDVDSTVTQNEAIDELAKFLGKGDEVAEITNKTMQGYVGFRQSLTTRLNIIRPTRDQMLDFVRTHPPKLSPGIKALVNEMQKIGKQVYLVSDGFRCVVLHVAEQLNIPKENVFANRLKFYIDGEYAGFDENEPTSLNCGKAEVIRRIKAKKSYNVVVHVGDSVTDIMACPPGDLSIVYVGNVKRESLRTRRPWIVKDFKELEDLLRDDK